MPKRLITADDLLRFTFIGDTQISPDGAQILFTARTTNAKNKTIGHLFTVDVDAPHRVRQWTRSEEGESHGRWIPGGHQIAFLSSRDGKKSQIHLIDAGGGEARKLTDLPEGSIGTFRCSPDGRMIAFTFREQHADWTQAATKAREESGASTPARVIHDLWYRLDGDGYFDGQRYAIYICSLETGKATKIYSADAMGQYTFDWSPNSEELIVAHSIQKHPWFEKPDDRLFRVNLEGEAWQIEGQLKGRKSNPRWSPDGKTIAYTGDTSMDDPWGTRNTRMYVIPAEGGETRCLTDEDDYCLDTWTITDVKDAAGEEGPRWSPDSKALYVQIGTKGECQLAYIPVDTGGVRFLTEGQHVVQFGSLASNGERIACTYSDPKRLNEVAVYDLNRHEHGPHVITHFNDEILEEIHISVPEEVYLESTDGVKVHVWTILPPRYLAPKRLPAVLEIHGGPHTQYGWTFFHEFQLLAAQGYAVVYSNPRGSKGYGEAFCGAIKGDWGNKDWDDMQTVIRWMQHQPFIHPGLMGVMGGSYGGYMTNWIVGHCRDFRAAITDRCVSNMVSMAGNSDFAFDQEGYFGGYAFGDLDKIKDLWRMSPLAYFDQVETPMLIIHSEGDLRCNIEQGEQVFSALQVRGIESKFVRYPVSTSHGLSRGGPADLRIHRLNQITDWWKKFFPVD